MASRKFAMAAAFVLTLWSIGCVTKASPDRVFLLDIAAAPVSCGDGSNVVAKALANGRARLNAEPEASVDQVVFRVHQIMSYRAERVVYAGAEAGVSWREFLKLVDDVWPEAEVISMVTPRIDQLARQRHCLVPSCGLCEQLR
jgi:hypothetical protein